MAWYPISLLVRSTVPWSGWTVVYLPIHLLKDVLVASKFCQV